MWNQGQERVRPGSNWPGLLPDRSFHSISVPLRRRTQTIFWIQKKKKENQQRLTKVKPLLTCAENNQQDFWLPLWSQAGCFCGNKSFFAFPFAFLPSSTCSSSASSLFWASELRCLHAPPVGRKCLQTLQLVIYTSKPGSGPNDSHLCAPHDLTSLTIKYFTRLFLIYLTQQKCPTESNVTVVILTLAAANKTHPVLKLHRSHVHEPLVKQTWEV